MISSLLSARVYDLEQPRYAGAPVFPAHEPGLLVQLHRRHERDAAEARTSASALLVMTEHSGTHMDALCHQAFDGRLNGGLEVTPRVQTSVGFTALGIDTVEPIVRRGVLLDVAGVFAVGPSDLERAAAGARIAPGRCGFGAAGVGCAVGGSRGVPARRRRDRRRVALAGGAAPVRGRRRQHRVGLPDDHDPDLGSLPGHTILIVQEGIHIIESLFLEELAADGVREFGFICLPLKVRGGTGSPVRPIALV